MSFELLRIKDVKLFVATGARISWPFVPPFEMLFNVLDAEELEAHAALIFMNISPVERTCKGALRFLVLVTAWRS